MARYWFITKNHRKSRLALFTFLLAFVVIVLGAYTRLTDAGLSCPDWPNCYGYMTAPHTPLQLQNASQNYPFTPVNVKKAWTEMTHRYAAGTEGLLVLILSLSIFFRSKNNLNTLRGISNPKHNWSTMIAAAFICLLLIQILLGMLTVTEKLKPIIVVAHLVTGLSLLSLLWWFYLNSHTQTNYIRRKGLQLKHFFWLAILFVSLQIILGGWVSTHYAGLACTDFPYCNGEWMPKMQWHHLDQDLISIHMLHRMGALITATYLILLSLSLLTMPAFRTLGMLILSLITLQLTLGIFNIIWLRPLSIALAHYVTAIILLQILITALVKSSFLSTGNRYGSWIT